MTTDGDKGDMTVRTPTLSVTYGAFSLTLEGFDDPFATMRDVADYFRAVLAEDRAFGSGAAAPRGEALRRFAEGRFGRAVDLRPAGERVHLRAASAPMSAPIAAPPRLRAVPGAEALFDEDAPPAPAVEPGTAPQPDDDPAPDPDAQTAKDPLSAAMAEPRADALPGTDAALNEPPIAAAHSPPGRRGGLPAGADEAAVERLISQADSALSGAEAQRRQATFAHLKAAVAATRAEADALGPRRPGTRAEAEIARYRDDLVRSGGEPPAPRRAARSDPDQSRFPATPPDAPVAAPAAPAGAGRRGAAGPSTPLLRAAEWRSARTAADADDGPSPTDPAPAPDTLFDEEETTPGAPDAAFARFLAEAAPEDLEDRIDAAAAWLCHAGGLEDFPRMQLTRLLFGLEPGLEREAVMRGLGVLLRDGRLQRSRRGQFQSGPRSAFAGTARRFRGRS